MNAKTTRLLKEARPLFWPWCAVTLAALLPLVKRLDLTESISPIGFFVGIPLLAALPFGYEFQHRTLSVLLAQPVDRMEIWREKLSVTVVAVLSAALVFFFAWRVVPLGLDTQAFGFAGAWVIGIIASAAFWTLFTRSTLGGVALNIAVHYFVIIGPWMKMGDRLRATGYLWSANITVSIIIAFLGYAGAMLWLGRRKLARFQVTGGMAGDDLLMAGPNVMPRALAGWFRCRPTGSVLNLIRKELRLLRPLWLITLLAVVAWTFLTMQRGMMYGDLGLVPASGSTKNLPVAVVMLFAMAVFSTLILAVLAGSLSLGEERTSGTHAWHMTLPVSASRQWLVKLLLALFAGVVCAVLLPGLVLIAGGFLFGSPFMFVDLHYGMVWLLIVSLLTLASFWCACAVNGTVRAAMWVFPVMVALGFAGEFGDWVAGKLMPLVLSKFDFITDFRFTIPLSASPGDRFFYSGKVEMLVAAFLFVPILVFAMSQSYRLFRAQARDGMLPLIQNLMPLAAMAFLLSFSMVAFPAPVYHADYLKWNMIHEIHDAIDRIQPSTANLDATHPLELTVEDLAKASPLSDPTRRWLRGSRISLAPGRWFNIFNGRKYYSLYSADIHLASGSKCTVFFLSRGPRSAFYFKCE